MEGQVWTVPAGDQQVLLSSKDDYDRVKNFTWHLDSDGYPRTRMGKRIVKMHRYLFEGQLRDGMVVDHKNGNKLDARRDNLRICTQGQNRMNAAKPRRGNNTYKGVRINSGGKFEVNITVNRRRIYVGVFTNEEEAARAYDAKAREVHGEYARPNFE